VSCDDGNACTADSCSPVSGCRHTALEECEQGDDHKDGNDDHDNDKDKDHGKGKGKKSGGGARQARQKE
jgi:hypothetical protein